MNREFKRIKEKLDELREKFPLIAQETDTFDAIENEAKRLSERLQYSENLAEQEEAERERIESECENESKQLKESLGNLAPSTLEDELKLKVFSRMHKNLTLEQLENIEKTVRNSFNEKKKNYIEE